MKLYDVVYADPPWRYSFSRSRSRKVENQYPTMSVPELCAYPIPAKDNAVLYLWATAPKLEDALYVLGIWGFSYKTNMVWDKELVGMGYWFRGRHELLLVGVRGKFSPPPAACRWPSVVVEARGRHSAKPDRIRHLIRQAFPDADCVELFARKRVAGWDATGDELGEVRDDEA